jgi:predicted secreted protein
MTTGYQWLVEFDEKMVQLIHSEYKASSPSRCGSGGHQIFNFTGLQEGKTQIIFRYQRVWEPEPIKREIYEITIQK